MSRLSNEIGIVSLVSLLNEVLSGSSARVRKQKEDIDKRVAEISVELARLKELANFSELKDKNLQNKQQSKKNQYGDADDVTRAEEQLDELNSLISAGNDLAWISKRWVVLKEEQLLLEKIEKPKLELYENIHSVNVGFISKLFDKLLGLRDRLNEGLDGLDDLEQQASNIPFPYGPVLVFLIKQIRNLIETKIFNPLLIAIGSLGTALIINKTLNG